MPSSSPRILLYPYGGLCNRLRAIESARLLAAETSSELTVLWEISNELACPFSQLFEPYTDGTTVVSFTRTPINRLRFWYLNLSSISLIRWSLDTLKKSHFSIPENKLHVIPHPHHIDTYPNTISKLDARAHLELPKDASVFLFLGRIEPYKGVEDLVDAFSLNRDGAHLVVAGKVTSQTLHRHLEKPANRIPNFHLIPNRIEDSCLQVFFNAADYVVFPFNEILTSGSLVRAMSFEKAVIAPKLPNLVEILPADGVVWFDPNDPRSLSAALALALSSDPSESGASNFDKSKQWRWSAIAKTIVSSMSNG